MLGSVQLVYSFDSQEVGGDAFYLSSHPVQHSAKLLHVGFAGGVVDGGLAFGKDGCHYDIGSARYRCFVQQHIAALQLPGGYFVDFPPFVVNKVGS